MNNWKFKHNDNIGIRFENSLTGKITRYENCMPRKWYCVWIVIKSRILYTIKYLIS